ncbi:MAG TPA: hypothetical protein VM889_00225 [Candidatus Thermoplasmatota archaeon]|nr:hypothetical protein [Candidatus Thermoplasmatota archaeon]
MPRETAADVVEKRRQDRLKGASTCTACGSRAVTGGGAATPGAPYRILKGGMHLGDVPLTRDDHVCHFCYISGRVRDRTPV